MPIDFRSLDERLKQRKRRSIFDPTPNLDIQVVGENEEGRDLRPINPESFIEVDTESFKNNLIREHIQNPYQAVRHAFGLPFYELKKPADQEQPGIPAVAPYRQEFVNETLAEAGALPTIGPVDPSIKTEEPKNLKKEYLESWQPKSAIGKLWKRVQEAGVQESERQEFLQIYEDVEDYYRKVEEGQRISNIANRAKDLPDNYVEPGFWGQAKEGQSRFFNNLMLVASRHLERTFQDKGFPKVEETAEKITDYFRTRAVEHPEWNPPDEFTERTLLENLGDSRYYARALSEGLPSTLISLGSGAATLIGTRGNTSAALGSTYLTSKYLESGFAYEEAIANGASPDQADEYASLYSTIAAGVELVPASRLLNKIAGGAAVKRNLVNRVVKELIIQGALEGSEEAIQESIAVALEKMYNENAEFWNDANVARILDSFAQGAIVGGFVGGGAQVIQTTPGIYDGIKQKSKEALSADTFRQLVANQQGFARIPGKIQNELDADRDTLIQRTEEIIPELHRDVKIDEEAFAIDFLEKAENGTDTATERATMAEIIANRGLPEGFERRAIADQEPRLVAIERFQDRGREDVGQFFATQESGAASEFGITDDSRRVTALVDDARLFQGESSRQFAIDEGFFEEISQRLEEKYGIDNLRDIEEFMIGGDVSLRTGLPLTPSKLLRENPNASFMAMQEEARARLEQQGYDGVHWKNEDELIPEQFQIWNQEALQDIKKFQTRPVNEREFNVPPAEGRKILQRFFPENEATFLTAENLGTTGGRTIFGQYGQAMITLMERNGKVAERVLLHEAFHKYTDMVLTSSERRALFKEVAEKHGNELSKDYGPEEWLADNFAKYVQRQQTFTGKIKSFFDQLIARIRRWREDGNLIQETFEEMAGGKAKRVRLKEPRGGRKEFAARQEKARKDTDNSIIPLDGEPTKEQLAFLKKLEKDIRDGVVRKTPKTKVVAKDRQRNERRKEALELLDKLPEKIQGRMKQAILETTTDKRLEKLKARVENRIEEYEKAQAVAEAVDLKKIADKAKITTKYQELINKLVAAYDFKKPTEKTLRRLRATREFLEKNPDAVIPRKYIERIKRLEQTALRDMSTEDLRSFNQTLRDLVNLGKEIQKHRIIVNKIKYKNQLDKALSGIVDLDSTNDDINRFKEIQNDFEFTFRVGDKTDGDKLYKGWHAQFVRDLGTRTNISDMNQSTRMFDMWQDHMKIDDSTLNEREQKEVAVHLYKDQGGDVQARQIMDELNIERVPELTQKQESVKELLKKAVGQKTGDIKYLWETTMVDPSGRPMAFDRQDNYFPFYYEESTSDLGVYSILQDYRVQSKMTFGSGFSRKKGVDLKPRTDIYKMTQEAIAKQELFLNMQPALYEKGTIFRSKEYQEKAGKFNSKYWVGYIDEMSRNGFSSQAVRTPMDKWLRRGRQNISRGLLDLSITSTAIQPLAVFDAMGYMTTYHSKLSGFKVAFNLVKAFLKPNFTRDTLENSLALKTRKGGEEVISSFDDKKLKKGAKLPTTTMRKVIQKIKSPFALLQFFDIRTAAAVQKTAFDEFSKTMDKETAQAEADFVMDLVSGSANLAYRPRIMNRGELGRALTTFQTFVLNEWGIATQDVFRKGIVKGGPGNSWQIRFWAVIGMGMLFMQGYLEDELRRKLLEKIKNKEVEKRGFLASVLMYFPERVPVIGNIVNGIKYGKQGLSVPVVDIFSNIIADGYRTVTGKKEETRQKALSRFIESIAILFFGIPGAKQAQDFVERGIDESSKPKPLEEPTSTPGRLKVRRPKIQRLKIKRPKINRPSIER